MKKVTVGADNGLNIDNPNPNKGILMGNIGLICVISLLFFLNSLKVTLFNFFIFDNQNAGTFAYKFLFSLMVTSFIGLLLLRFRSRYLFLVLYIIQGIYIFANLTYHIYFHNYLHLFQATVLFSEGVGTAKHFSIPLNPRLLVIFIDLPLFFYIFVKRYFNYEIWNYGLLSIRRRAAVFTALMLLIVEVMNFIYGYSLKNFVKDFSTWEPVIVERYGTLANSISDIAFNSGNKNLISHFKYGKTIKNTKEAKNKPNMVAIQVESMDSNILNQKHNGNYVMPYLNSLCRQNIYFPYLMSYHEAGGTSDSEFSILNSIEPLNNFPSIKLTDYDYKNSILKDLTDQKYEAFAFHGNKGAFYNRDMAFPKMGFNEFFDIDKMGLENQGWGAPDASVFDFTADKLKNVKNPFFAYVITMSSHSMFTNVKNYYNNENYNDVSNEVAKNYFNSMSYVDVSIWNFVNRIQAEHKNTYFFIYGDHAPAIKNEVYSDAVFEINKKYFEFVPLIIITPDKKAGLNQEYVASFLDLAPTILYSSGVKFELKSNGINLLKPFSGDSFIPFRGVEYSRRNLYKEALKNIETVDDLKQKLNN